ASANDKIVTNHHKPLETIGKASFSGRFFHSRAARFRWFLTIFSLVFVPSLYRVGQPPLPSTKGCG
ncbi:MAG: hypothetical protein NC453_20205, partial [Muribaculum sp.]|nr:hypothetical protein [Muribaculum sp.]